MGREGSGVGIVGQIVKMHGSRLVFGWVQGAGWWHGGRMDCSRALSPVGKCSKKQKKFHPTNKPRLTMKMLIGLI